MQAVPPSGKTQIRAPPYLEFWAKPPPLQDSRYALFRGYPQCGGSMPQQAMRTFSQPRSGIRARNVVMPRTPRIQLRQVQDQDEKVMRSFQRFGQLTWSKSRDRPGQGFKGQAGSTAEVEARARPPRTKAVASAGRQTTLTFKLGQSLTPLVTRLLGGRLGVAVMRD